MAPFSSELDAHRLEHAKIQQLLQRGGRTYGARLGGRVNNSSTMTGRPNASDPVLPWTVEPDPQSTQAARFGEPCDALAEFMGMDAAYMICRRFSRLNTLNLLWVQEELADLEGQYHQLRARNSPINNELTADTTAVLKALIRNKLHEYDEALLRCARLSKLDEPDRLQVAEVRRWVAESSISSSSVAQFLQEKDMFESDLAAIVPGQANKSWLYRRIEDLFWGVFSTHMFGGKKTALPGGGSVYVYEDNWVRITTRALLAFVSAIILSVPLGVLSKVDDRGISVTTVAVCSAGLAMLLATGTSCRDHEIIVAVSAYAAVLIVFAAN